PTLSAEAMRALILSVGHDLGFEEMTATRCVMLGQRRGSDKVTTVTWTMDDARRAHLDQKPNWRSYPKDMLVARATGQLKRAIFADVGLGIPYVSEELEDGVAREAADGGAPPPAAAAEARKQTKTRRAAQAAPAPPPAPEVPAAAEAPDPTPASATAAPPPPPAGGTIPAAGDPSQAPANEPDLEGGMTIGQQVAMVCRQAGIERRTLL